MRYHAAPPVGMEVAFRAMPDGGTTLEGYTALYDRPSKIIRDQFARSPRGYVETLRPGAFRRSLGSGARITLVVDHDERKHISTVAPYGQLRLAEDSTGLHVASPWPRTDYADNVRALHEAGESLGMSVTFGTPRTGEEWPSATERIVTEAVLRHASVLATMEPAYDGTVVSFRALADLADAPVDDIDALMDALREGRRLDDAEFALLGRLADVVRPEAPEPEAPPTTDPGDAAEKARWLERLARMTSELPDAGTDDGTAAPQGAPPDAPPDAGATTDRPD